MKKKHVVFMVDDTTDQTHVEESHMADSLNNPSNAITSYTTNLTNIKLTNNNLEEKIKVEISQNKVLTDLLRKKINGVTATQ